ncbi:hypothetical protein LEMLEM_LOCUS7864, partial [Lemmus lemmus]
MESPCCFSLCLTFKSEALGNCHSCYQLPKATSCRRQRPVLKLTE